MIRHEGIQGSIQNVVVRTHGRSQPARRIKVRRTRGKPALVPRRTLGPLFESLLHLLDFGTVLRQELQLQPFLVGRRKGGIGIAPRGVSRRVGDEVRVGVEGVGVFDGRFARGLLRAGGGVAEGGLGAVARVRGQIDLRVREGDLRESVRVVGSEGEELADRFESMGAEFVLEPGADPAVPGHERFFD